MSMALDIQMGTVGNAELTGRLVLAGWASNPKLEVPGMKVIKRHRYTCQYCGFISRPSKQVLHGYMVPVDFRHPALLVTGENGTCLCPFCACYISINWSVIGRYSGGKDHPAPGMLIHCPWLTQRQVSLIALHAVSISACRTVGSTTTFESAAIDVDATMVGLNHEIGAVLPIYRGKDSDFARALAMLPEEFYEDRAQILANLRWWPTMSFWSAQGMYWMKSTYTKQHIDH